MANAEITLGCDPEMFVANNKTGQIVPSCGLIGGTKHKGRAISTAVDIGLEVLEDNVTLEFNIAAQSNATKMLNNVFYARAAIEQTVLAPAGLMSHLTSGHEFDKAILSKNPAAMVFGCDPDRNAWNEGKERRPPNPAKLGGWRFAGGHVHIGYDKASINIPQHVIVMFLDAYCLTYWSAHFAEGQQKRRSVYGLPGLYRDKPYGLEYRSPNNMWLDANYNDIIYEIDNVMRSILNDEDTAYSIYKRTNWKAVFEVLTTSTYRDTRHKALMAHLNPLRGELMANLE